MTNQQLSNSPTVRIVPASTIRDYSENPRNHSQQQRRKLEAQIRRFGQVMPLVVDENSLLIDGHLQLAVLKSLGFDQVVTVVVGGHSEPEIRALRLALNRIPQDAGWDQERLRVEVEYLIEVKFDLELTGFSAVEIDHIVDVAEIDSEPDIPTPTIDPVTRKNDVWNLGRHRIGCGDALDADFVTSVLDGTKPTMAFIDPPYNVPIDGHVSGNGRTKHREFAMASGEMSKAEFIEFLAKALRVLGGSLIDGAVSFTFMDWRHLGELLAAGDQTGLELINLCVWTKTTPGLGLFYRSQHELVAVHKVGKSSIRNNLAVSGRRRNRSNVWSYRGLNAFGDGREELVKAHPTVKPVALIADAIRDVSGRGETVIDTFLGSGSTLIAAEETGRRCCGVEIDPAYVDVTIRRWQDMTRQDAVLAETGETFSSVRERQQAKVKAATNG